VWQPTETTTFHAGYAAISRRRRLSSWRRRPSPLLANTTAAPAVIDDSPVKAERALNFDIRRGQIVLPGLKIGVDAYYKIAKNLVDEGQFGAPVILTPFKLRQGLCRGHRADHQLLMSRNGRSTAISRCRRRWAEHHLRPVQLRTRRAFLYRQPFHPSRPRPDLFGLRRGSRYTIPWTRTRLAASVIFRQRLAGRHRHGAERRRAARLPTGQSERRAEGRYRIFQGLELRSTSSICSI